MYTVKLSQAFDNYLEQLLLLPLTNMTLPTFQSALMSIKSRIDVTDLEVVKTLGRDAIDVCGTGGSGVSKFNTSTTVAFILAGLGVKVTKFGNRSATSRSGSVDFLESLGFSNNVKGTSYERVFQATDLVFLNAQSFFPQLAQIKGKRQALGHASIFNYLGPLLNPAQPAYRLLGVSDAHMQTIMDRHLQNDKTTIRALTVRADIIDELLPFTQNSISLIDRGELLGYESESRRETPASHQFHPGKREINASSRLVDSPPSIIESSKFHSEERNLNFGTFSLTSENLMDRVLPRTADSRLRREDLTNKQIFYAIINGDDVLSSYYESVVLNAAAGLFVMGLIANIEEGKRVIKKCLASGSASRKFEEVRRFYQ